MPAAAAPGKLQGPQLLAPRAPGRAARTATATPGSVRQTTAAASWCEVSGQRAVLAHRIRPPHTALLLPPPPNACTQPVSHHSVIHSASIILSVYCVLNVELSAGDKAANGTKEIPVSLPYISQPLGPAAHSRPIPASDGGGGTDASAGSREPVSAPRPKRRVRRRASRALSGVRTRRDQRLEPREEKAGAPLRGQALPRRLASLVSHSQRRRLHWLLAGEGTRARSAGCAALARLGFARFHFLAAPGPSRPSPGLAFHGSRFLPRPSPSSLLSWPFLSAERSPALFSYKRFWTAPEYPAPPGLLASRPRLLRPLKRASLEAAGSAFAGSGPRPERWEEKGNSGVSRSACP